MDFELYYLAWPTIGNKKRKGVIVLNEMTNEQLCDELYKYKKFIRYNKDKLYWKHDINNSMLTPLQLNPYLTEEKYEFINTLRENLWRTNETHISDEELKQILSFR